MICNTIFSPEMWRITWRIEIQENYWLDAVPISSHLYIPDWNKEIGAILNIFECFSYIVYSRLDIVLYLSFFLVVPHSLNPTYLSFSYYFVKPLSCIIDFLNQILNKSERSPDHKTAALVLIRTCQSSWALNIYNSVVIF